MNGLGLLLFRSRMSRLNFTTPDYIVVEFRIEEDTIILTYGPIGDYKSQREKDNNKSDTIEALNKFGRILQRDNIVREFNLTF